MMFDRFRTVHSVIEISRAYPGEWVAIHVTATDADGFASAGELVAHGQKEEAVWSSVRADVSREPIYIFHTGSNDSPRSASN